MERLAAVSGLVVRQQKEVAEVLTGFETQNKYAVMDTAGNQLYRAFEESNLLARQFLRSTRPFSMHVVDAGDTEILRVERPFKFYFHEVRVLNAEGRLLGSIQRRFSIARRLYSVFDAAGREQFELFGPILHPWTFNIMQQGRELGKITKKWSGLLTEGFTDADNFGVVFPSGWDADLKGLFLGAVFLIDFVHFEENQK